MGEWQCSDCGWLSVLVLGELQGQVSCKMPPVADDPSVNHHQLIALEHGLAAWLRIPCRIVLATPVNSACDCRCMQNYKEMLSRIIYWVNL